jgi:hypothetical protein
MAEEKVGPEALLSGEVLKLAMAPISFCSRSTSSRFLSP